MNKTKYIYILGPGHCGSTIFEMYISQHNSDYFALGEIVKLDGSDLKTVSSFYSSKKNFTISDSNYKTKFRVTSFDFISRISLLYSFFFPTKRTIKSSSEISDTMLTLLDKCITSNSLIDSSKEWQRLLYLINSNIFDIQVIFLYRSPLDIYYSYFKKYHDSRGLRKLWSSFIVSILLYISKKVKITFVNFNDFCVSPSNILKKLCLNSGYSRRLRSYCYTGLGGNRVRDDRYIYLNQYNKPASYKNFPWYVLFSNIVFNKLISFFHKTNNEKF